MSRLTVSRAFVIGVCAFLAATAGCSTDPATIKQRHTSRGDEYFKAGQFGEAVIEYQNALQQDPKAADVREKLADSLLRADQLPAALREYVRAADQAPDNLVVQMKAGQLLLRSGQFADAKARAENVLLKDSRHVDAHILKANALIGLKDLASAAEQIEDAIKGNPDRGEIYTNLGAIEMDRGDRDAAEQAFRRAAELAPQSVQAHLALGNFYWMAGRWSDAEQALKRALGLAPNDLVANRLIAYFYLATNRLGEAEAPLKKLYEITKAPAESFALADYYVLVRNVPAATAILESLEKKKETTNEARVRRAILQYRTGRRSDAHALLKTVLAGDAHNERALLVSARFLLAEKRLDEALAAAKAAVAAKANSSGGYFLLGQVHTALRQPVEATKAYQEALRLNPRATDAKVALAKLELDRGETESSLSLAREALKSAPTNLEAQLVAARALMQKNELIRAEIVLNALAIRAPKSAVVQTELGMLFGRKGNLVVARKHFEQALMLQPGYNQALLGLAAIEIQSQRFGDAKALMERVVKTHPTPPNLILAARTYASMGDGTSAERLLKQALEKDPAYLPAYLGLGQLYLGRGQLADARREFETLSKRVQRPVAAMTMVGIIYEAEGNVEAARQQFERVLELDPRAPVASNNLAWIFAQSGTNIDRALELAQNAVRALPDEASTNDTLGYLLSLKGLHLAAIQALSRSVEVAPANALYHYHLGKAYLGSGDARRADASLKQALKLNPAFDGADDAKRLLAQIAAK